MIDVWIIWLVLIVLTVNTISALITVFHRPRNIVTTWAWILVLVLLPIVGFLIYAFLGRGIAQEKIFNISKQEHYSLSQLKQMAITAQKRPQNASRYDETRYAEHIIRFFNETEEAPLTRHNEIELFFDGKAKFEKMFEDIKNAKETVHVEYYAFIKSHIGDEFLELLTQKAKEGLEVRLLYDPWGSNGTKLDSTITCTEKLLSLMVNLVGSVASMLVINMLIQLKNSVIGETPILGSLVRLPCYCRNVFSEIGMLH